MKKLKVFTVLFMLSLMMMIPRVAQAAQSVSQDGISVTNITSTTAYVDWSGVTNGLEECGYVTTGYTVTWWSALKGTNVIVENSTCTNAALTGLPSGTSIAIEVKPQYVNSEGETGEGYRSVWFETDGATDLNVDINTTPDAPQNPGTSVAVTLQTPTVSKTYMSEENLDALAANIDPYAQKLEWQVIDIKNGNKVVATDTSYTTGTRIYNVGRKILAVQCRVVGYDSDHNEVYSDWSAKSYVIAQPKVSTSKKNLKKNSITVSFKKIKGAKDYTIYMRKKGSSKWTKVKTTSKNKYKVTKFKGKKINLAKTDYEFCVVANAKVGGKTIKSSKSEYVYTRYYSY